MTTVEARLAVARPEAHAVGDPAGKPQVVPLSSQAQTIIAALPSATTGPFLFSSDGGATEMSGFSKAKARLDGLLAKRLGKPLAPWVVLDLAPSDQPGAPPCPIMFPSSQLRRR